MDEKNKAPEKKLPTKTFVMRSGTYTVHNAKGERRVYGVDDEVELTDEQVEALGAQVYPKGTDPDAAKPGEKPAEGDADKVAPSSHKVTPAAGDAVPSPLPMPAETPGDLRKP